MNDRPTLEEEILVEALSLPETARRAFIEKHCGSNGDSVNRLLSLIDGYQENSAFLEIPAPAAALKSVGRTIATAQPEPQPGDRIHRYHLLEKIGEGGFGVVYLAEQEHPVRRRVALKIIRLGLDTREFIARFELERQSLASMDHPNIARVYDAGATDQGRPYLVMELIRGEPITTYADRHALSIEARISLFIQVCSAIQHAHQKGVIHRDLKPSNILIELQNPPEAGCPKVIDFGIAKATREPSSERTSYTRCQILLGTPAYTSPEQMDMSGLDVDTRADVYSLGVLLYELLVGRPPFDRHVLERASLEEMRRMIRETDPPNPSARIALLSVEEQREVAGNRMTKPDKLARSLRHDLDWIILRCLEKDRTRRYETANALAMDLRRYLENEPIMARPPGRMYRLGKFVKRNRTGALAATLVVIALVGGVVVASVGFGRARVHQHEAETTRREAEDLVSFMIKDLRPELQRVGRLPLSTQIAERAALYFSKLPSDPNNASTERNRAVALEGLAYVRSSSGNTEAAAAAWHQALLARQRAAAGAPQKPLFAVELALAEFIEVSQSPPLVSPFAWGTGSREIDARLDPIVNRARAAASGHFADREVALAFAHLLTGENSYLNLRTTRPKEALAAGREAESLYRKLIAGSPENVILRAEFVRLLLAISTSTQECGDLAGGIKLAEEALALADRESEKNSGNIDLREIAADAAMQLCYELGDTSLDKARTAGATARERWGALLRTDPQNFNYRHHYAWAHHIEADYLYVAGRKSEGWASAELFAQLLAPVAKTGADLLELRFTYFALAACSAQLGNNDKSREYFLQAQEWHQKYLATFAPEVARTSGENLRYIDQMCMVLECRADWPELERQAHSLFDEIAKIQQLNPAIPPNLYERANAGYFLGRALLEQGHAKDAVPLFREAARDSEVEYTQHTPPPPYDGWSLFVKGGLAEALVANDERQEARAELEKNLAAWENIMAEYPVVPWDSRAKQAEVGFLLATTLDPAAADEAQRRTTLLDHAELFFENHPAGNPLNWRDAELLAKIKTVRGTERVISTQTVSTSGPAL